MAKFEMTLSEVIEYGEEDAGICVVCGEVAYGIEPDAMRIRCEGCGKATVWGVEQAVLTGLVSIQGE